jgi:hypothetical protein
MYVYITTVFGLSKQNLVCHSVLLVDLSFVEYMMKGQEECGMKGIKEGKNKEGGGEKCF